MTKAGIESHIPFYRSRIKATTLKYEAQDISQVDLRWRAYNGDNRLTVPNVLKCVLRSVEKEGEARIACMHTLPPPIVVGRRGRFNCTN
jgi:hypothetical protein